MQHDMTKLLYTYLYQSIKQLLVSKPSHLPIFPWRKMERPTSSDRSSSFATTPGLGLQGFAVDGEGKGVWTCPDTDPQN